jgi:hypothetical protein
MIHCLATYRDYRRLKVLAEVGDNQKIWRLERRGCMLHEESDRANVIPSGRDVSAGEAGKHQ